jgi:hypothetical protein
MKTRNSNLKETAVKSITIFTTVFVTVLAISVNALAGITNSEAGGSLTNLPADEKDVENNVEEWMLNTNKFYFDYTLEEATEADLEIESWMLNENSFAYHFNMEEATEETLELETWMTDVRYFGMVNYLETEIEEALEIENWMLEDSLFNKKTKEKAKAKEEIKSNNETLAEVNTKVKQKAVGITNQNIQFGRRAMILIEDEDPKLKMEQWMLDYRHWKTK